MFGANGSYNASKQIFKTSWDEYSVISMCLVQRQLLRQKTDIQNWFVVSSSRYSFNLLMSSDRKSNLNESTCLTSAGVSLQVKGPEFDPQ